MIFLFVTKGLAVGAISNLQDATLLPAHSVFLYKKEIHKYEPNSQNYQTKLFPCVLVVLLKN